MAGFDGTVINCTIADNRADYLSGGVDGSSPGVLLGNCIVWNNAPDEIWCGESCLDVSYSNIGGGWPGQEHRNCTGDEGLPRLFLRPPEGIAVPRRRRPRRQG